MSSDSPEQRVRSLDHEVSRHDLSGALSEAEQRLALALRAGDHAPFELDLASDTVHPSPRLCEMLGLAGPFQIRTRADWLNLIVEDDRPRVDRAIGHALLAPGEHEFEYRVRRQADGAVRWLRTRCLVQWRPDGTPTAVFAVATDITGLKEAAEVLRSTAAERHVALEIAQLGTWEYDRATQLTRLDRRSAELLGLQPHTPYESDAVMEVVHPDDRERVGAAAVAAAGPSGLYRTEYRVVHDGGIRSVAVRGRFVPPEPETGGQGRFVGTLMEVTEQKRIEAALRNQAELLTAVIDHIPVCLVIWDPALESFRFNRHLREVLGWTEADTTDGRFMERAYPDPEYRREVSEYMLSLAPGFRDLKTTAKDGTELDISWANVRISGGTMIGIGVDIRARKAAELAMARANEQLAEADRRKDEFIALLAHELRNPLAPVRTAVGILRARGSSELVVVRCHDVIERQVAQMARLLDDLLDVSRLARGKLTLQRGPLLLKDVLDAALEISRPLVEQMGQQVVVEAFEPSLLLDGDAARLTQVFGNLLNNASKYSDRGGRIEVRVSCEPHQVAIAVKDAGIGIAPPMLDRIFELFTQVEGVEARAAGGLGIGLSLARRLVEMHGGTLTAWSEGLGKGSEFTAVLPVVPVADRLSREPADGRLVGPLLRRRVLVADDNADSAEMMATLLGHVGCEVRTAGDGEAAIREADSLRPDLLLLDIGMPGMNGYEVCERLRHRPWAASALFVAVTGWGQDRDVRRSAEAGFDRHLVKPVDAVALLDLVRERRRHR